MVNLIENCRIYVCIIMFVLIDFFVYFDGRFWYQLLDYYVYKVKVLIKEIVYREFKYGFISIFIYFYYKVENEEK